MFIVLSLLYNAYMLIIFFKEKQKQELEKQIFTLQFYIRNYDY